MNEYASPVEALGVSARSEFISRTYTHLLGAVLTFIAIEYFFFQTDLAESIAAPMLSVSWLWILGGFIVVSWIASRVAWRARSPVAQYSALFGFILAEALIFVPILYLADSYAPGAIRSAATTTVVGFVGLTLIALQMRREFKWLGALVRWGMLVALLLIVAGILFGFQLGTYFSVAMVALAGASILYDTSKVLRRYPLDRHVGAALELFASVAMMFWYLLRLFMNRD